MLIDWFTVAAQVVNFLILVWLMKRFLYAPILHAIDAREKRIAQELADADAKKIDAQQERDEFQRKNETFDKQRAELMSQATEEAKAERQRLFDEARNEAAALSLKRQEILKNESQNLHQEIIRRTQQEVFNIARKTLTDLAAVSLEDSMVDVFLRRLSEMDASSRKSLVEALKSKTAEATVRSAFKLSTDQRQVMQQAFNETLSANISLSFEAAPDLISGIEFTANGHKVAWNIADYLESLSKGIDELLQVKNKIQSQSEQAKTEIKHS